jgi:hypothetical protein
MMGEMLPKAIETVGNGRAGRAAGFEVGAEHEVIDDHLRPAAKQVLEGRATLVRVELIIFLDLDPRQILPSLGKRVAGAGQLLFGLEEFDPLLQPFVTARDPMCRHCSSACFTASRDCA